MKVRALRGVCIGVERHLALDDEADLEAAQVQFLVSIGAVELVLDESPPLAEGAKTEPVPSGQSASEQAQTTTPGKPGKKEK